MEYSHPPRPRFDPRADHRSPTPSPPNGTLHTRVSSARHHGLLTTIDAATRMRSVAFPTTPVHQVPRRPQANRFGAGAGHERLKLGDRDWREASEPHLSELQRRLRFGHCLRRPAAVRPDRRSDPSSPIGCRAVWSVCCGPYISVGGV